jgi:hypothetical protein
MMIATTSTSASCDASVNHNGAAREPWDDARYSAFLANTHAGIVRRMEFTYRLTGTGWAEAQIADATSRAVITASYLSDALGDLLEALGTILEGAAEARCSWEEEPGEYRWIFAREDRDQVTLRILVFADMYARPDTAAGVGTTRAPA